ncbi:MAG TPA: ArsR family transcriptional regulator [Anaeromyxobacteraceae bacterium]|nr:ArsR family transcriptional regulator [Anaeromyxobacteraceae bacterium]
MTLATARDARAPSHALSRAELRVADAVGALMELWGFRRQLGRIWAVLFLSERPLAAPDLCQRLGISTGLLSMSLAELRRWGVVHGVSMHGDRKEHYRAETDVWRMVRRVLAERERRTVEAALSAFEAALAEARGALQDAEPRVKRAARHQVERLSQLVALTRSALGMLRVLLETARLDLSPLRALSQALSGRGRG